MQTIVSLMTACHVTASLAAGGPLPISDEAEHVELRMDGDELFVDTDGRRTRVGVPGSPDGIYETKVNLGKRGEGKLTVLKRLPLDLFPSTPAKTVSKSVAEEEDGVTVYTETLAAPIKEGEMEPYLAWLQFGDGVAVAAVDGVNIEAVTTEVGIIQADNAESLTIALPVSKVSAVSLREGSMQSEITLGAAAAAAAPSNVQFRYATFIDEKKVDAPLVCNPTTWRSGDKFNGNNRSWRAASNTSSTSDKTRMSFGYSWSTKKFGEVSFVGKTILYNKAGKVKAEKTASSSGMKFWGQQASATYARIRLAHDVGNPLCNIAGKIHYTAIVDVYSNGTIAVTGSQVAVPNHEIVARFSSKSSYKVLMRSPKVGFHCLNIGFPACPQARSFNIRSTL